jgi:hypothetical protein
LAKTKHFLFICHEAVFLHMFNIKHCRHKETLSGSSSNTDQPNSLTLS